MMTPKPIKIAYLAPEIPALSATFVYNEILGLEAEGFDVVPISVHMPLSKATGDAIQKLGDRTRYLYTRSGRGFFVTSFLMLMKKPISYVKALSTALSDVARTGMFNRTAMGLFYRFLVGSHVANILIQEECRHLHVHFAHIPTDIAMYASSISGIPFSFTSHANDLFERGWLLKEKVERSGFGVTISEHNRRFLAKKGAAGEKIHVVHCGVDASAFNAREPKTLSTVVKIGTLGRMVEKKGFDILVNACKTLKNRSVSVILEIAGDGPMREALENLAVSLDLSAEIRFIGPLFHSRVPEWMKGLDLFVLPCRKDSHGDMDGIPVVLMEAMLSGVPVVSTKLSGIPELVQDGKTGVLSDPDDPEGLASAIQRILSDASLRNVVRKQAIETVRAEFDLSKNVSRLSNLFRRVMT